MRISSFIFIFLCGTLQLSAQAKHQLVIDTDKQIAEVTPTMWGVFFEDINFSADGGIYAELVKNRSFEFRNPMVGWRGISRDNGTGDILVINRADENSRNPRFARVRVLSSPGAYGLSNEGFRGMGVREGEKYNFYVLAKKQSNDLRMIIELVDQDDRVIGKTELKGFSDSWNEYQATLTADKTTAKARLNIFLEGEGIIDLDMISLFPEKTWKNRPKGLRADLVGMLDGLQPGFVRFPGGCIVEGYDLVNRYQWKNTVGPINERILIKSRWMDEFRHRYTPDYYQSYGLGFYEYFLLSEDLGAEPLPILNCGMACQYNSGEVAAMDELGPYIQDALDLIEFANGSIQTKWGKLRAKMGHPEPFNLTYLGIGNEQWGEQYIDRYREFHRILKEKHPEIVLISASGPRPDERNEYLWEELTRLKADIIDEHYYMNPDWFFTNATRYDSFDRKGPKVFAGEYASHTGRHEAPEGRNNWLSALSEAAFMTGLERNADVVVMTSYAPLFAHREAWQWNPDLIWFDNLNVMPTPNYYIQQMFSVNKGDRILSITENELDLTGQDSLYSSVSMDDENRVLLVKLVNVSKNPKTIALSITGSKILKGSEIIIESMEGTPELYNEVGGTDKFPRQIKKMDARSGLKGISLDPLSVNLVKIQLK